MSCADRRSERPALERSFSAWTAPSAEALTRAKRGLCARQPRLARPALAQPAPVRVALQDVCQSGEDEGPPQLAPWPKTSHSTRTSLRQGSWVMTDVRTMIETAHRNVELVSQPLEGRRAAEEIAKVAAEHQADHVIAASAAAEKLCAAMAEVLPTNGPTLGGRSESVVLFDINFASGTEFARAALRARGAGAKSVYGVALYRLSECSPTAVECGLDDLVVLRAETASTSSASCSKSDDISISGLFI